MTPDVERRVRRLHEDGRIALVLLVSGGGTRLVDWLHSVPGASRTMLESRVPYAASASDDWTRSDRTGGYTSRWRAAVDAERAYERARELVEREGLPGAPVGLAVRAALSTSRELRGGARAHVSVSYEADHHTADVAFSPEVDWTRDRQEAYLSEVALQELEDAAARVS